jgi:phosphatidylethanolamine-binding protein (PEBP) family uncharacterized protein
MRLTGYTQIPVVPRTLTACVLPAVLVALALVGCGGSSTSPSASSSSSASAAQQQRTPLPAAPEEGANVPPPRQPVNRHEHSPSVSVNVTIPGLPLHETVLPTRYTCDGANTSLPVRWTEVPHNIAQMAVFVINLKPVKSSEFFDWAVTGLSPSSHGISPGALPPGAVVGRNSFGKVGYSICPPKGAREIYVVRVVALAHPLKATSGFDAQKLYQEAERSSKAIGLAGATYSRS